MHKHIKIILAASAAFNILFLGVAGGHVYKRVTEHPVHMAKKELSPETRNLVGRTFQSAFREMRPLRDKARKARAQLVKVISADEFDSDAFDQAAEKFKGATDAMRDLKTETAKTVATQMTAEERRKMAERMTMAIGGGYERKVKRERRPRMIKPDRKPEAE